MANDETEAREPDDVSQAGSAQAGASKSRQPGVTAQAFTPPNYQEMNARISETRKQSGPPLKEDEAPTSLADSEEEEEQISPTTP